MHSNTISDIHADATAYDAARALWLGPHHRILVDDLRRTAQRRTRVRVWMRRATSWI